MRASMVSPSWQPKRHGRTRLAFIYNYLYTERVAPTLKPIAWMGDSRDRVRFFSRAARRAIGPALQSIQEGLDPEDWKPMPRVGAGVKSKRSESTPKTNTACYTSRSSKVLSMSCMLL